MQELKKKNVKVLSEKVLLLLNRGGKDTTTLLPSAAYVDCDPVWCYTHMRLPPQTTLCACSNTPHLRRTRCSSSCRMFSPAGRQQTCSTAPTWWWWSTSLCDKYLTSRLVTRWHTHTHTQGTWWLFRLSLLKKRVSYFEKTSTAGLGSESVFQPLCCVTLVHIEFFSISLY